MAKLSRTRTSAYLALLGNAFLWGLAFPIVKRGFADGLSPNVFLLGRFLVAALVSGPLIWTLRHQKSIKKTLRSSRIFAIVALELLGTVLALYLLYQGLVLTTAVEASLIAVTWPIFVTLGGIWFLGEKEEDHEAGGLILAVVGTLLLVLNPLLKNGLNGHTTGNLLILAQNLIIATYYLLAKKLYRGLNKWAITHLSFLVGLFAFAILFLAQTHSPLASLTPLFVVGWPLAAIIYMGIFGSVIALTLYLIGQEKIEASEAAIFTYLQPIIAIPAAIFLLGESISAIEILATLIIAFGVYLSSRR